MKAVRKILSVILTLAMLLTLTPMVFAVDEAAAPRVPVTEPTGDRVFCVVNDCVSDIFGSLYSTPEYIYVPDSNGNNMKLSTYVNEDGTFTVAAYVEAKAIFDELVEEGVIEKDIISGISVPKNVNEAFELVTEMFYSSLIELFNMMELEEYTAALTEAFPDGKALHAKIMSDYFGDRTPTFAELLYFILGDNVIIDDEGYIMALISDAIRDEEDYLMFIDELIAPNGAYNKISEEFGNYRNVYAQLKDAYEAKEITAEDAFTLLTGYYTDPNGYLYTVSPIFDYFYNKDGNRIHDPAEFINEDGTVLDTGLSPYDFAVDSLVELYKLSQIEIVIPNEEIGEYFRIVAALLDEILPEIEIPELEMTDEDIRNMVSAELNEMIEMMMSEGLTESEINAQLICYGNFEYDFFGYFASGSTYGYIYDADGNKLKTSDIMDSEGKFLTDEYGAETVWELLEAYIADIKTDIALKGDATGDSKVNLNDASAMLKKIANWDIEIFDDAADVNGDEKVNLTDVSLVLKYIAGWDVSFVY